MKNIFFIIAIIFVFFAFNIGISQAQVSYPEKKQEYVNDFTSVLGDISFLENKLKDYEEKSTNKINVVVINTSEEIGIDQYTSKLYEKWRVGKEKDNGILISVFLKDKKIYIKTGYGLASSLTGEASLAIISKEINPYFQKGMYLEGLDEGIEAIISTLSSGEYQEKKVNNSSSFIFTIILLAVFIFLFIFSKVTYHRRKRMAKNLNKIRKI